MSRDLLLGEISGSVARDDASEGRLVPGEPSLERLLLLPAALGLTCSLAATALVLGVGGRAGRAVERAYYRTTWRDLKATRETPAASMRELVYGPRREE